MQTTKLQVYFPMLKTRREILEEIGESDTLCRMFNSWKKKYQEEFLDFCTGAKGVKMLYDSFAKELLNPSRYPERLNEIISLLLGTKVEIIDVLPNEGIRIAAEQSLLTMDMVVKLGDGSIANVEIQKVGYAFPGQRCACYSADLLLRQYKAIRASLEEKKFSYREVKSVYSIIFFEKSPKEFHVDQEQYLHYFQQRSDTKVEMELLQKYVFITLDNFMKKRENKDVKSRLFAWLLFLGSDDPEDIIWLIEQYPDFKAMYQQIYEICENVENAMGLFSKELEIMDRNTVKYMMDEMQEELNQKNTQLELQNRKLKQQEKMLAEKEAELQAALSRIAQLESVKA